MMIKDLIVYLILILLISCKLNPPPKLIKLPPTKKTKLNQKETIYTLGYMSGYDIWEFLREKPSQKDVIETFGLPDSVWLDDVQLTKFLYYYISDIQDYNTIEISTSTDSVSGFEWD